MLLLTLLFRVLAPALCLAAESGPTLPEKHAEYMKDETYKFNYEAFTEVINQIKGYYGEDEDEYAAFVKRLDGRIAGILKSAEDEREGQETWGYEEELTAWGYAWGVTADELNLTVVPAERLKRGAKGAQGYWELKDDAREGYMLVENTGGGALFTHSAEFRVAAKGAPGTNEYAEGYFSGYGNLKDGKLSAEYEYDTSFDVPTPDVITIHIEFDGETARVSTSEAFKKGGLGKDVVYDGEYVRVRKD
ncbi:MAG: hypothetical protein LBB28_02580 [Synergistaceae bacterium]|nr:hypothetical protein [Synergistaceae bacterium]